MLCEMHNMKCTILLGPSSYTYIVGGFIGITDYINEARLLCSPETPILKCKGFLSDDLRTITYFWAQQTDRKWTSFQCASRQRYFQRKIPFCDLAYRSAYKL